MTDSDDTDELLLIRPDIFTSNPVVDDYSTSVVPYYSVVDSLITQVNHLEGRVNCIESSSEISERSSMNSPSRFFNKGDPVSTQSTPQRPRTKFSPHSLPNSPDVKTSPQRAQRFGGKLRQTNVAPMLGEIDSFLSNVKLIKRVSASRNLEHDFDQVQTKKLDLEEVNEMLKDLEQKEQPMVKEKVWQAGDNINSVPDYGWGMRKNMYPESGKTYNVDDTCIENTDAESSSESQITAFEKVNNNKQTTHGDLGLLSLAKLWNSEDFSSNSSKFKDKLQEERLRRQHCEHAIQELQHRVLELQERVAVAVQVDEAKDGALLRFRDSWRKADEKLRESGKVRRGLEEEVAKLRRRLCEESDETHRKLLHVEEEASKALHAAHGSQEQLGVVERRCEQLEHELKMAEARGDDLQRKCQAEAEKHRQYPEIIVQKELELNDCKSILAEAHKEVSQSKETVDLCQAELTDVKRENESLLVKLDSEKQHLRKISEQKGKLLEEVNAHKTVTKGLQEELIKTRDQMESNKVELKNFYQGQVELVVQSKLKEFQSQLDEAEKALKAELSKKELSIAKTAALHIQQISEKQSMEIKLLEEKHYEECRLYQLQLAQFRHELEEANAKLKRQRDKHVHIEKQLHKFMEALRQDHVTTLDEMNSFRSRSFNNLEELLSLSLEEGDRNRKTEGDRNRTEEGVGDKQTHYKLVDTPLTSRNEKGVRRKENTLQETIQMLLDKKMQGEKSNDDVQSTMQFYKLSKDTRGKPPWK